MGESTKIDIYTDGACSTNGTWDSAYAFVVLEDGLHTHSEGAYIGKATNNVAELAAVLAGLQYAITIPTKEITIYSDSAYIVNCFNQKWYINWEQNNWQTARKMPVLNQEYWRPIIQIYKNSPTPINFVKVKGHSGDKINTEVDRIAVLCKDTQQNYLEDK